MDAFLSGLSTVLSSLGSNGILPIMLLILGLIFGLKFGEALRASCGIAFAESIARVEMYDTDRAIFR